MRGFTIIETLVVIVIFAMLMGVTAGFIVMAYRTQSYTWQQSMAINEARKGVETMVKEIREAKTGEDGSYALEYAGDKEFIFYSDIDKDGDIERVRYFLGTESSGSQTQDCVTFINGGSCNVTFSNFLTGSLKSAEVIISVEGDINQSSEYVQVYADGNYLNDICRTGCLQCSDSWGGNTTFDIMTQAADDSIQFTTDGSPAVGAFCNWIDPNHSLKSRFEFSWTETLTSGVTDFKKGVVNPTGSPPTYPLEQEEVTVLTSYVRNAPPIFEYFDENGDKIESDPARLADTKIMKVFLIVNIDPNRAPQSFELESSVQLRNLKEE